MSIYAVGTELARVRRGMRCEGSSAVPKVPVKITALRPTTSRPHERSRPGPQAPRPVPSVRRTRHGRRRQEGERSRDTIIYGRPNIVGGEHSAGSEHPGRSPRPPSVTTATQTAGEVRVYPYGSATSRPKLPDRFGAAIAGLSSKAVGDDPSSLNCGYYPFARAARRRRPAASGGRSPYSTGKPSK